MCENSGVRYGRVNSIMELPENIRRLDGLSGGYQRSLILFAAIRAGVFELLQTPRTAEDVAAAVGWHPRGARMLLDGLLALDLVEKTDGGYCNAAIASACLVGGSQQDQRHIILHRANGLDKWLGLEEALRAGHGRPRERKPQALREFICGMSNIARDSARGMLDVVDLSGHRRMLDVGGGPGTYSIAFLQAHPALRATVLDLPEVLPITREQAAAAQLEERMDFFPADMTRDAFPAGYDLVLLSNIIHSFGPETNQGIIRKCYEALDPGGILIIKDFLVDSRRTGPPFSLLFALQMFVSTEDGDTHALEDVAAWTATAGFEPGRCVDLTRQSRLWIVRKPPAAD